MSATYTKKTISKNNLYYIDLSDVSCEEEAGGCGADASKIYEVAEYKLTNSGVEVVDLNLECAECGLFGVL